MLSSKSIITLLKFATRDTAAITFTETRPRVVNRRRVTAKAWCTSTLFKTLRPWCKIDATFKTREPRFKFANLQKLVLLNGVYLVCGVLEVTQQVLPRQETGFQSLPLQRPAQLVAAALGNNRDEYHVHHVQDEELFRADRETYGV